MKTFAASLVLVPLAALPFLVVACGGAVAPSPGNSNGGGGSPSPSATNSNEGEWGGGPSGAPSNPGEPGSVGPNQGSPGPYAPPCPNALPADGASCANPGTTCEYNGIGPADRCSTIASCYGDGNGGPNTWHAQPNVGTCVATPDQNPSACPATIDALLAGSACPVDGTCVYPEGVCGCNICFDAPNGTTQNHEWMCSRYPGAPSADCPSSRPELGIACATEGQTCSYGQPCDFLIDWSPMECKNGMWQSQPHGEDCAAPTCMNKH